MFRGRCFGPDVSGARCDIELPVSYPPVSCRAVPMSRERHQPKPSKPEPPGVMRFLIVPIPRLRDGPDVSGARCDNTTLSTILLFYYSQLTPPKTPLPDIRVSGKADTIRLRQIQQGRNKFVLCAG